MTADAREIIARAIREEVVRQYRDDDRSKWPGGSFDYEEHQAPALIADAILSALSEAGMVVAPKEATEEMQRAAHSCRGGNPERFFSGVWSAMLAASTGETK